MNDVAAEGDLIARKEGAAGIIRLNRPKAINAVTLEMFHDIDRALDAFEADPEVAVILLEGAGERGLCAGGDIRALWESSKVKGDLGKILWRDEYILNARIKKFPKPYVAFMDGIVMGGGMGLLQAGTFRIVTPDCRLAMPEVSIGLHTDVGASWFLPRLPGRLGLFVALTGTQINARDALDLDLADRCLREDQQTELLDGLVQIINSLDFGGMGYAFLVSGDGSQVKRFAPTTKPEELTAEIEALLK